MARFKKVKVDSIIKKKEKEGRGKGHGTEYIPWLTVRDVPSRGNVNRPKGWITKRHHHLLSNLELAYFYVLEWSTIIKDIREQFPLPLERTLEISERIGVKHPTVPGTNEPAVMTTDFLLDVYVDGHIKLFTRSVKESKELSSKRTLEKLEIERVFWKEQGNDWGIITERDISMALSRNVQMIHKERYLSFYKDITENTVLQVESYLYEIVSQYTKESLSTLCLHADEKLGFKPGACLTIVKHLLSTRAWEVDMNKEIDTGRPLEILYRQPFEEIMR
ncbi:heteromeric transposase endonuclease subunit TnsA [Aneurinibacillus sp. BA2021]|nr:heteromeric transposase endonuclease subunit TnsA [Aneurinibacillus sp. BA2021]